MVQTGPAHRLSARLVGLLGEDGRGEGAVVSGVFSARFSHSVRHGRGVMLSVIAYGAAMLLLGVVLLLIVSRGGAPAGGRRRARCC